MKKGDLFQTTAFKARHIALKLHQEEVDKILPLVDKAAAKGDLSIVVPKVHDAVRELLETEHGFTVKTTADYDKNPAILNSKISW